MITNFAKKSAVSRETFSDYFAHSYSVVFFAGWFWKEALLLFKEYIIINAESHDIKDIITVII